MTKNANMIAIYTTLKTLRKMKEDLGMEAMVEFIDLYTDAVEKKHPELSGIVSEALADSAINHFYEALRA